MGTTEQNQYTTEQLLKETLWEHSMLAKGRDVYYAAMEGKELIDTSVGTSLIYQLAPLVVASIKAKQAELADEVFAPDNRDRKAAKWLLPMVNAENLAVAALRNMLGKLLSNYNYTLRATLDLLEESYIEAMGIQLWEQDDPEASEYFWRTQADKLSAMTNNPAQAKVRRYKLKKKLTALFSDFMAQEDDTQATQLSVATTILDCIGYTYARVISEPGLAEEALGEVMLVDGELCYIEKKIGPCCDIFVVRDHLINNTTKRMVYLTESAEESIDYSIERGALLNPALRPMLIKPRRWLLTTPKQ